MGSPLRPRVATVLGPLVTGMIGENPPVAVRCWDESVIGPPDAPATMVISSPRALRRLLWAPNELGLGRAYVAGELDVEGDIFALLALRDHLETGEGVDMGLGARGWLRALRGAVSLGAVGRPLPPPPQEVRLRGRRHSRTRDAAAIAHHYDLSNEFYRMVLGPTMTYSCAYFETDDTDLDDAQRAKYDLICRKLGLDDDMRLLDVGCGWGGMVLHAAEHYNVRAVGVTVSARQAELATDRVERAGLAGKVEIRLQDYRDIDDGPFDAISSIGMFEHVGLARLGDYFERLRGLLRPGGRLLNHAISRPALAAKPGRRGGVQRARPEFDRRSFIERYIFPDAELHEVGTVVSSMQEHGFEVRDVESLREHYARTLRAWAGNLDSHWDEAVQLVGASARIWRLYIAGCAVNFEINRTSIHQVLGVKTHPDGRADMPLTRAAMLRR